MFNMTIIVIIITCSVVVSGHACQVRDYDMEAHRYTSGDIGGKLQWLIPINKRYGKRPNFPSEWLENTSPIPKLSSGLESFSK